MIILWPQFNILWEQDNYKESAYDKRLEQWSVGEMTWTRSEVTIPITSMSQFNLDFRVKAKVPFPQFLLHHG